MPDEQKQICQGFLPLQRLLADVCWCSGRYCRTRSACARYYENRENPGRPVPTTDWSVAHTWTPDLLPAPTAA